MATTTQKDPQGTKKKQSNKVRFVRTKEGEKRYGKPIGSVIVSDTDMENIKYLGNTKNGWGIFKGKNGKKYQVGKVDGLWVATPFGDSTRKHSLVEGGDLQATLKALNRRAGNKAERREDTEYDRNKRAGRRGTVTGEKPASTRKRKTSKRKKASDTFEEETGTGSSSSRRSSSRSSSGSSSTSKAKNKKVTKKKGDYTGPNLRGLKRLVNAGLGNASSGAERAAAMKVMKELQRQGLVKRTKVKGKIKYLPADGYSASDVAAGATESNRIDKIMYDLQRSEEKAMAVAQEIEARANVMFAELKGLRLYDGHKGHISSLQQKDMGGDMELKVRRVRTPAGVRRFGLPIGSIIGSRGKRLKNLSILDPIYDDWDLVKDSKGKKYDIGQDDDGKWRAFGHNDWDDMVVESDSEDGVYEALNDKLGGNDEPEAPQTQKKPRAKRREWTLGRLEEEQPELFNELLDSLDDDEMDEYIRIRNEEGRGHARALQIVEEARDNGTIKTVGSRSDEDRAKEMLTDDENLLKKINPGVPAYNRASDSQVQRDINDLSDAEKRLEEFVRSDKGTKAQTEKAGRLLDEARTKRRVLEQNLKKRQDGASNTAKQTPEPKDPSYRRGADRLRRAGIKDFRPNQARQVDEMTRDQWEEAQLEVDAGASISEVLAKRAVARREAQEERQRAYNGGEDNPTDKEIEEEELRRRGHELVSKLGPRQKREYDALKPRYQEMYRSNRAGGDSHKQAMDKNPSNARRVPNPNTPGQQVAERTQGAGKPKAERTDAEIEASLNNAFKKQFDTLSGSQKRKYFAAFRQGKTHSEAMAEARGGSGKAQGTLF